MEKYIFYSKIREWSVGKGAKKLVIPIPKEVAEVYQLDKKVGKEFKVILMEVGEEVELGTTD